MSSKVAIIIIVAIGIYSGGHLIVPKE